MLPHKVALWPLSLLINLCYKGQHHAALAIATSCQLLKQGSSLSAHRGTRAGSAGTWTRCCTAGMHAGCFKQPLLLLHACSKPVQLQAHLSHSCHELPFHLLLALHQLLVHQLLRGQLMAQLYATLLQDEC